MLSSKDYILLTGLKVSCIIGIFDWERKRKQDVLIDLRFPCDIKRASRRDRINETVDYKRIAKFIINYVENSEFHLIETLAEKLAALLLQNFGLQEIDLTVSKPGAVRGSQNVGIRIHRVAPAPLAAKNVFLGLGSNIRPRENLEKALGGIQARYPVIALSHAYETSPVGFTKQAPFWNLVIAVETGAGPNAIRKWIGSLQKKAGRRGSINPFGPRTLDVDLLLWGDRIEKTRDYSLPHPDIETKAFVLFPLLEIAPNLIHPVLGKPVIELAARFKDPKQKIRQLRGDIFEGFFPENFFRK